MHRALLGLLVTLATAACGGTPSPAPAPSAALEPERSPPSTPTSNALVLGLRMNFGRFDVLEDGTVTDGTTAIGSVATDRTLRRTDGSVLARLGADDRFVLEPPTHIDDFEGLWIEGNTLVMVENGRPEVLATIDGDTVVGAGAPRRVEGLTPARYRTILACHALVVLWMMEYGPIGWR